MPTSPPAVKPKRRSSTSLEVVRDSLHDRADLADALRHARADAQGEAILWQRWVRYLGVLLALLVALLFGAAPQDAALVPTLLAAGAYVATVLVASWRVKRSERGVLHPFLPGVLVTADIGVTAAFFYFASSGQVHHRMLLIGLLAIQLSVFYFGRWLGAYTMLLTAVVYVLMERVVPPFLAGPRATLDQVALNTVVFLLAGGVMLYVLGSFRERMDELRLFCKLVEEGEITTKLAATRASHPDDLTLLARSFEAMRDRFAEQIGSDPLTGCVNRRALENRLRADWRLAKRRGSHVAVVAIDLDHFKKVNDTRGHPVGDVVLQQLAGIMKATARDTDTVARLGGDEFVVVLPDTGWEGAVVFADRLLHKVREFAFGTESTPVSATVSIGVALARGTDPISPDVLLHEADRSLYKAKTAGRDRVYS
ncbi:MAG TPA: GGDEF domain-containing protein [Gemmatimonadaceae bacterium]|nr:GGDEF domain-containing protein [Gemmatimonadaceae bacterium]